MNTRLLDRVLAEYEHQREADADPELAAVRAAIFVEDVFNVTLSDEEIDLAVLSDPVALRALVTSSAAPR